MLRAGTGRMNHKRAKVIRLELRGLDEEPAEEQPEIVETPELIEARAKRDKWKGHATAPSATAYAREQARIWEREVAELEQLLRPIPAQNIICDGRFDPKVIGELRSIREQVARGPSQMEML